MNASDRQIISMKIGYEGNGIYAIAHKIPNLIALLFNMFGISWQQEAIRIFENDSSFEERNILINKIFNSYIIPVLTLGSCILASNFIFFDYIFDNRYFDGINYVSVLILATILSSANQFFGGIQIALKRTRQGGATTIVGAIVNIIIHFALIDQIGLYAACISTVCANLIILVLRIVLNKEEYK